jgi:tRNA dimethylallyltransferase
MGHRETKPIKTLLIAGPTASGKSALALELAEKLGGTIVNADSMQVYRDLRVITARSSPEEERRVPHRLYGHVDAAENYSVGRWCREVSAALKEISAQGRIAALVGGTGLYFKTLTTGLAAVPPIPSDIRDVVRKRIEREGAAVLHTELAQRDPVTAQRLMINDRSRISRALEVVLATGRSLSDWHRENLPPLIDGNNVVKIFITCERAELTRRIEKRFTTMLADGALEEVQALTARNLNPSLPAMKAHGVPWLIRHLNGEISIDEAIAGAVMDTRRYAKRQVTWFRHQLTDWPHIAQQDALGYLLRELRLVPPPAC